MYPKLFIVASILLSSFYCANSWSRPSGGQRPKRAANLYVSLYEHENYRGQVLRQPISRECRNMASDYDNWASSVVLHDRCVTLCEHQDCRGVCTDIYPNKKGEKRLSDLGLNDKVSSIKYCYKF